MSELNLHIGDCIHYGGHGVCRICGRETKTLGKECRDYFLLRPVGDDKTILYLPADAQPDRVKLRNVLSAGSRTIPPAGSATAGSAVKSADKPFAAVTPVP